jgi:hypothetical protein
MAGLFQKLNMGNTSSSETTISIQREVRHNIVNTDHSVLSARLARVAAGSMEPTGQKVRAITAGSGSNEMVVSNFAK